MPADYGLGLEDDEDVSPVGPAMTKGYPEESVQGVHCWPRPFAFEHGKLLPKCEDLDSNVTATAKEDPDGGQD